MDLKITEWTLVVSVAAIVVAVVLQWMKWAGSRKALTYEFLATEMTRGNGGFEGLQMVYRGQEISDASIVGVVITNTGKVPIPKQDFEGPLRIEFSGGSVDEELLAQHVFTTRPVRLPVVTQLLGDGRTGEAVIEVKPLLLNPGDSFSIVVLVSEFAKQVRVNGRIAGVKTIENKAQGRSRASSWIIVLAAVLSLFANVAATSSLIQLKSTAQSLSVSARPVVVAALVAIVSTVVVGFVARSRMKPRR